MAGSTNYYVSQTLNECESKRAEITVIIDSISAYAGGPVVEIMQGQPYTVNGSASPFDATITWAPDYEIANANTATPIITPLVDTVYTMIVTSTEDCSDTSTLRVIVLQNLIIPNVFSPNGDGINDKWIITHMDEYATAQVEIFDRYGQMIFQSMGGYSTTPWDGTYNGKAVPVGTYFYIINLGNGNSPLSGSVSVIR